MVPAGSRKLRPNRENGPGGAGPLGRPPRSPGDTGMSSRAPPLLDDQKNDVRCDETATSDRRCSKTPKKKKSRKRAHRDGDQDSGSVGRETGRDMPSRPPPATVDVFSHCTLVYTTETI